MPDLSTVLQWASAVRESLPPFAVDVAVASMAVLAAAAVVTRAMSGASAAARHLVWCAAVGSLTLLPVLSASLPGWDGLRRGEQGGAAPASLPPLAGPAVLGPGTLSDNASAADALAGGAAEPRSAVRRASVYVTVIWAAGALWLLVPPLAGRSAMRQLERRCDPVIGDGWDEALANACAELRLRRPVRLLVGNDVAVPMTWGTLRPRVLLPSSAACWSSERRRVVLLHELGHVARLDCLTHLLAQVVRAAYWFNPLAWVAVSRMRVERERACDDLVLRLGTPGSTYADHLVAIVSALKRHPLPWAAAAMARSSEVGRRVREILEERRNRRNVTARHAVAAAALMLVVTVPLACMKPASANRGGARPSNGGAGVPSGAVAAADATPAGWTAEQVHAADDLRLLAAALVYYSAEYRGRYPGHHSILFEYGYLGAAAEMERGRKLTSAEQARVFLSPQDERRVTVPEKPTLQWLLGHEQRRNQYVYLGADARQLMGQPFHSTVLLMHTDLNAPFRGTDGSETAVGVFFDGHAEILPLAEVRRLSEQTKREVEKLKPLWAEFERRDKERAATRPAKQQ